MDDPDKAYNEWRSQYPQRRRNLNRPPEQEKLTEQTPEQKRDKDDGWMNAARALPEKEALRGAGGYGENDVTRTGGNPLEWPKWVWYIVILLALYTGIWVWPLTILVLIVVIPIVAIWWLVEGRKGHPPRKL